MCQKSFVVLVAASTVALGACGGGGGGNTNFTPPPPSTPTPPSVAAVTIFPQPVVGEYASVGASIAGPGGNLDTYASGTDRFGSISSAASDQVQIRYTQAGHYEIQMPGATWDRLIHYGGLGNPTADNNYFQPASVATNFAYLVISNSAKWDDYRYSEMGGWGSDAAGRYGSVAFGVPTQAGAVPTTGSASFGGKVQGSADIMQADNLYGGYVPLSVDGTVTLNFNFAAGTLAGQMTLWGPGGMNPFEIGTFAFKDTVFSVGSTTYSGKFDSAAPGDNFFLGRFTGPNAEETIGAWAVPFVFTNGGEFVPADGQPHQAFGAWIAKRP